MIDNDNYCYLYQSLNILLNSVVVCLCVGSYYTNSYIVIPVCAVLNSLSIICSITVVNKLRSIVISVPQSNNTRNPYLTINGKKAAIRNLLCGQNQIFVKNKHSAFIPIKTES